MAGNFPEELLFHNVIFSDELLFHATLLFNSYTYLWVTNYDYEGTELVTYSLSVEVLSFVSIIAQSRIIDKVYLISWLHKVLWNWHFFMELLLE